MSGFSGLGIAQTVLGLSDALGNSGIGTPITLGPVAFNDFEVPERIKFGGEQKITVHTLPGGERVIDAMGRDDMEISWTGIFSGPAAMDRARMLDALRVAGDVVPLAWGGQYYSVVICRAELDYKLPQWVPYTVACTVLRDEAAAAQQSSQSAGDSANSDVSSAAANVPADAAPDGSTTVSQETVGAPGVIKTQKFVPATTTALGTPSTLGGTGLSDNNGVTTVNLGPGQAYPAGVSPTTAVGNAQVSVGTAASGGPYANTGDYRVALGDLGSASNATANARATSDAGLEAINAGAPNGGLVSGPIALQSATQAAGQSAQMSTTHDYLMRATNSMIGGT